MNILAQTGGRIYGAVAVNAPGDFASPFDGSPFSCMIWDHEGRYSEAQRLEVARGLLRAGCRYVVCGGENCEAWHDNIDAALVLEHLGDTNVPEATHVMTTWHPGEDPDDVAFFLVHCANVGNQTSSRYLVLHVGTSPARRRVDAAVRQHAMARSSSTDEAC